MFTHKEIADLWDYIAKQDAQKIKEYFHKNAVIYWHNTNERFTLPEYIRANCEYPGNWQGKVERIEILNDTIVCVARVWATDNSSSHHVCVFYAISNNQIIKADEYWGDDGPPPQWRTEKNIGRPITNNSFYPA